LAQRLLGQTLIVRDLRTAREITGQLPGHRFVTLHGDVLEPDGTLTTGTHHAESGILSRKSELRELKERVTQLDSQISDSEHGLASTRERIAILDAQYETRQEEITVLLEQATELKNRMNQHRERRQGLHEEVQLTRSEISTIEREIQSLEES